MITVFKKREKTERVKIDPYWKSQLTADNHAIKRNENTYRNDLIEELYKEFRGVQNRHYDIVQA